MSIVLDLAASQAKGARAFEHLQTLNSESRRLVQERYPGTLIRDFNPQTGWLKVSFQAQALEELSLAVILGEFIHNLRSALDYIVTALAAASEATLSRSHQFPIYSDAHDFRKRVGTSDNPRGPLRDVRYGFGLIEQVQPYNLHPSVGLGALAVLQRLSNSDKHRTPVPFSPIPEAHEVRVEHDGTVIEERLPPGSLVWEPNNPTEILSLRFAHPYPTKVNPQAQMQIGLQFWDAAFPPDYPDTALVSLQDLGTVYAQVGEIVDTFSTVRFT